MQTINFILVFYLKVCASGVNARSEVPTRDERVGLVVEFPDKIYLIDCSHHYLRIVSMALSVTKV